MFKLNPGVLAGGAAWRWGVGSGRAVGVRKEKCPRGEHTLLETWERFSTARAMA